MKNQKVVFITGCSSGIGRELCKILSDRNHVVIATARNKEKLENVPASLKLELDVTDEKSIQKAVAIAIQHYPNIDILVNNAGYSVRGALEEIDINAVKNIFDVNVFGIIHMVQAVLPFMRRGKKGKIINIGSVSGKLSQAVNGGYCASKHAVEALSDALRLELHQYNIQSTVIEPGPVQTNFFHTLSKTSDTLLKRKESAYVYLHQADLEYRRKQKLADSNKSADQIIKIMMKKKLKNRYKVAVPFALRILLKLPDTAKDFILLRHLKSKKPPLTLQMSRE